MSDKACDLDTYLSSGYDPEDDRFYFTAECNGGRPGDCGWEYDLSDTAGVARAELLDLDEAHRRHSATVAVTG